MPDTFGWPTASDVADKLQATAPNGLTDALIHDLPSLTAAVIAHFQSPVGKGGKGGTGRRFTATAMTRAYDGNGYPELRVDDIAPDGPALPASLLPAGATAGATLAVQAYDALLPDVVLKSNYHGLGYNVLARPQSSGALLGTSYGLAGIFPLGKQNIFVTATFGYSAVVPPDVYEAVRCEAAYRALVQSEVGIDGFGEQIKIGGSFEFDSSVGASQFDETSSLMLMHRLYQDAVLTYRDTETWRAARLAKRMS